MIPEDFPNPDDGAFSISQNSFLDTMSHNIPYIYFQTSSQFVIFSPFTPKDSTITDLYLSIHSKDSGVLSIDFFKEIDFPNVKVEKNLIDLQQQIHLELEFFDENGKALDSSNLPKWISKNNLRQILIPKKVQEIWSQLEIPNKLDDRQALIKRRQEALERRSEWEKQEREALRQTKILEEKRLFDKQWDMERERRNEIDRQKKEEDADMRKSITEFSTKFESTLNVDNLSANSNMECDETTAIPSSSINSENIIASHQGSTWTSISTNIFEDETESIPSALDAAKTVVITEAVPSSKKEKKASQKGKRMLEKLGNLYPEVPVRVSAPPVKVSFTPRVLRSAARQDKDAELLKKFEIWKRKNRPDRIENNPMWIKQRGDKFFEREDYLAAINAYTTALRIDPEFLLCYANRAACHLKRGEYSECIDDCNRFLITRPGESSASSQESNEKIIRATIKVLARRGSAHFHIGERDKAIRDYELALQMSNGSDEKLEADYKKLLQEEKIEDENKEKQLADVAYKENRFQDAIALYSQSINKRKNILTCRSNRAACHLKIGNLHRAIVDSTFIIDYIQDENKKKIVSTVDKLKENAVQLDGQLDELSEEQKQALLVKAFVRRGTSHCLIGRFQDGYADYTTASRLAPNDEALLRDMEKINLRLQSQIHPDWYKNRGNYFFQQEEYETAIQSYSLAIQADNTNPVYFSNRAQCHLKLREWLNCIHDIDAAFNARIPEWALKKHEKSIEKRGGLEKVTEVDAIPSNPYLTPTLQLKLYMRRAACYKALDEVKQAMTDYRNALKLDPNNRMVKEEIKLLEPMYNEIIQKERQEQEMKANIKCPPEIDEKQIENETTWTEISNEA